jgi:glutaredoxin 3
MLNLYYKPSCPYCMRVVQANDQIGAPLVLHNILEDATALTALLEKGDKRQVPFLEDTDRGVSMYESLDIVEYLRQHYGGNKEVNVPHVGNVCPID